MNKRLELPALHRKGHQIEIEISIVPIFINSEEMFTAFIRDITDQKLASAAVEKARVAADQANKAKTTFLATMSHEIRSPLNAVINMNELLLDTNLSSIQRGYAAVARDGGITLLALINDILDFTRIEAGKVMLEKSNFNPVESARFQLRSATG